MLTFLILACATPDSSEPLSPAAPPVVEVRLALNWFPEPEFGGFYEGVLGGHYQSAGFDVTIVPGGPGAPSLELLASGRAEAAITSADDLLVKRAKGLKAVGVWPAFQLTPQGLMVHQDSGVATFEQIPPGSRVAIEIGSPFQSFLWKRFGWEGKVEAVPYGGSVGPFLNDTAAIQQAYITSEPCVAQAQGAHAVFLKGSDAGWNPYGTLLALSDPPPEWAAAFLDATAAAWRAYIAAPDRANAEITRLNPEMKSELMGCITAAQAPFLTGEDGLGSMTEARWAAMASTLAELGLLPQPTAVGAWSAEGATAPPQP